MAINNIDSQFAAARAEVRSLIKHCKADTNIGGRSIDVLQSIVDTLDAIQNDSRARRESFDRYPQTPSDKMRQTDRLCFGTSIYLPSDDEDPPTLTKPDFNLSAGLEAKDWKRCKF